MIYDKVVDRDINQHNKFLRVNFGRLSTFLFKQRPFLLLPFISC